MHVPSNVLSSFVTLFVTIGPIETSVVFAGLTMGIHHRERRSLALHSVAVAGFMLVLFALAGNFVLFPAAHLAAGVPHRWGYPASPAIVDPDVFKSRTFIDQ